MWDAIRQNQRRSMLLLALMAALLLLLGYLIGAAVFVDVSAGRGIHEGFRDYGRLIDNLSDDPNASAAPSFFRWTREPGLLLNGGGFIGAGIAAIIWSILALFAFYAGDRTILRSAGAHELSKEAAPMLCNIVEEMTIAAGLPKPPRVFLIDDDAMNAFAVGLDSESATVAVTAGLARRMTRDELQGVVAHEIAHVHNQDIRFMTLAAIMVGSIVLISEVFLRSLRFTAPRRSSGSSKGGGQVILLIIAVLFAILAPIAAHALYFACSRRREYLADACAARFTRYPLGLASALEKIGLEPVTRREVSRGIAPLYIANPLQPLSSSSVFSSHPPLAKRIAVLRAMSGAGYADYESAYQRVLGSGATCIQPAVLQSDVRVELRAPTSNVLENEALERTRETLGVLSRAADYVMVLCPCGVRLKVPPGLDAESIQCPKCGHKHSVPTVRPREGDAGSPLPGASVYHRTSAGWESFRCECGKTIQLSPSFSARRASCKSCGRHIEIVPMAPE